MRSDFALSNRVWISILWERGFLFVCIVWTLNMVTIPLYLLILHFSVYSLYFLLASPSFLQYSNPMLYLIICYIKLSLFKLLCGLTLLFGPILIHLVVVSDVIPATLTFLLPLTTSNFCQLQSFSLCGNFYLQSLSFI